MLSNLHLNQKTRNDCFYVSYDIASNSLKLEEKEMKRNEVADHLKSKYKANFISKSFYRIEKKYMDDVKKSIQKNKESNDIFVLIYKDDKNNLIEETL
jgi:hypothetical protein